MTPRHPALIRPVILNAQAHELCVWASLVIREQSGLRGAGSRAIQEYQDGRDDKEWTHQQRRPVQYEEQRDGDDQHHYSRYRRREWRYESADQSDDQHQESNDAM